MLILQPTHKKTGTQRVPVLKAPASQVAINAMLANNTRNDIIGIALILT